MLDEEGGKKPVYGEKPEKKVRKQPTNKSRGRSPAAPRGAVGAGPPRKNAKSKSPTRLPPNLSRGGTPRSSSPTRDVKPPPRRHASPKRNAENHDLKKERKEKSPIRTRSPRRDSPGRGRSTDPKSNGSRNRTVKKKIDGGGRLRSTSPKQGTTELVKRPSNSIHNDNSQPLSKELSDDEATEYSEGEPRYVSRKGNCTHLQLDLSKVAAGDMPVFSLLDEDSLLGISSTDDDKSIKSNSLRQKEGSSLDIAKAEQQTRQQPANNELDFKPWEFSQNDQKEEVQPKKGPLNLGFSLSPKQNKGTLSPTGLRRAVKAFKYNKSTMSGASDFVEKLSTGLQQRMGLNPHQHMEDDDDLDELLP